MKQILSLVITGLGIYILLWSCSVLKQSREASAWPQAKAVVSLSELTINHLSKLLDWSDDPMRWYGAEVHYKYYIGDKIYFSNKLSLVKWGTRSVKEALKVMNKYRDRHERKAYYDPKDPDNAVLEPLLTGDIFTPLMIGIVLTFLGLIFLYYLSLEVKPGISGFLHQGQIYQNQGKIEEALGQYTRAVQMNPQLTLGYRSRGGLYLQQEQWDLAVADFNKVIVIDPDDALVYFALGTAYAGKKEYAKALEQMNKAVQKGFNVKPETLEEIKRNLQNSS